MEIPKFRKFPIPGHQKYIYLTPRMRSDGCEGAAHGQRTLDTRAIGMGLLPELAQDFQLGVLKSIGEVNSVKLFHKL